ncbi:MAG: acylphosphatase [Candidatus Methylomirabilia bacterium]
MSSPQVAVGILVEGLVQGVGYRDFVQRRASHFGLTGYVMNLPDGRVRVQAEGRREVLEELVKELEKGPSLARVTRVSLDWVPPTGRFSSFRVRFAGFEP